MEVIIFGGSGLIGSFLVDYCVEHEAVSKVKLFGRKPSMTTHPKLEQHVCDPSTLEDVVNHIKGDVVFNCLGTTKKDAGSEQNQYAIDCTYPVSIAKVAAKNHIPTMISVSSVGASPKGNFYLKTKADMEEGIDQAMTGKNIYFLRPSLLMGNRKTFRLGERISQWIMPLFSVFLQGSLEKYRPIQACEVAKAMLGLAFVLPKTSTILHYHEISKYAKQIGRDH